MKLLSLSDYIITEQGEIYNKKTGRKLKSQPNGKGYLRVSIGGKLKFVHRLVAEQYLPNPESKPQINHKDGNKLNNCVDNLEWVSNLENRQHAVKNLLHLCGEACPHAKLTKKDVEFIRNNTQMTAREIAAMFNVSASNVKTIRQGKTWKQ
jgi:DNA-binding transcriptional regulator YiaG